MTKTSSSSYQQLAAELDSILVELQQDETDIDLALKHYQRGLELVQQLENYLKSTENKIQKLNSTLRN